MLQTPLLGRQVYLDTIARFPRRFDNAAVRTTLAAGSVAPRVELLGPGGGEFLSGEEKEKQQKVTHKPSPKM